MSDSRVILVTGANQGIGYEVVRQLAKQSKDNILYLGARNEERGKEAEAKLHAEGLTNVTYLPLDVTSQDSVDKAVKRLEEERGRVDSLVNNAGIVIESIGSNALDATADMVKATFEVNYFGVVRMTHAFIPLIKKSKNPIILNVSSGLGSFGIMTNKENNPYFSYQNAGYNPSKSALDMYTHAISFFLPEARVNVINPGYTATNLNNYSGVLTPAFSAEGVIKYGLNIDQSGPTGKFLCHTGAILPW